MKDFQILPIYKVYGMGLQLLSAVQISKHEDVGNSVDSKTVTECLFTHNLQSLQSILPLTAIENYIEIINKLKLNRST